MGHSAKLNPHLVVELATKEEHIRASQQLRYQVFAVEQGAMLESADEGLDRDEYDPYCHHILVRRIDTQEVVGSTRVLTFFNARKAGGFYSENEFDLRHLFAQLKGNTIEIGRTCVHPDYRNGSGIAMLWSGLARFCEIHHIDYLFGCASISLNDGGQQVGAIMQDIRQKYMAPQCLQVTPKVRLLSSHSHISSTPQWPPLLKAYTKLGAWVAGEPCFDPDFNVADVFILLDMNNLNYRYHRHFLKLSEQTKVSRAGFLEAA